VLHLEQLEARELLTGSWTGLTNLAPDNIGTMMLLSDGTVMAQNAGAAANQNRWYRLTPSSSGSYINGTWSTLASMSTQRLYYGSNILQDGRVFLVGGEYSGPALPRTDTNTGEIYNPLTNSWSAIQNFPQHNFGDDPTEVLPDGRVLGGFESGPQTYIYNPATNTWTTTPANKLRNDQSDEEAWVKLPDNSILSYDVWSSIATGTGHAQRYVPSSNTWVDAGTLPALLSTNAVGDEMGPGFLLPDGRVFYLGGNGNTAYYTPSTNSWVAGPAIPGGRGADDAPGAMLLNGNILFAADTPLFNGPTHVYEFTPGSGGGGTYADVTPSISGLSTSGPSFTDRMLVLPTGQVLYTTGGNKLGIWTPNGSLSASLAPAVSTISGAGTTLSLTGTQLNGISEGASYGDDAEMSSNYPIVRYRPVTGSNVSYARTANWSLTGVATGSTSESVNFTIPSRGIYLLNSIANGIASPTILNVEMTSTTDNLLIRNNPSNSGNIQVVSGSTVLAETPISGINKIIVTCDSNADTLTVSYQFGNALPVNGLEYAFGAGVDTLNVNDTTTTTNQTFTLGTNSVQRSGSAPITFLSGGINFVNVNGGSGGDTYNVLGTEPAFTTTINAGGADTVNVGNAGNLAGIQGTLTLNNGPNWSHVNINDGSDNANHTNVMLTATSLTNLAPAVINFQANSLRGLTITVGNGNNTYTVVNTAFSGVGGGNPTTLNTGNGNDTVNVQGTDATAPLTVNAGGSTNDVVNVGNAGSLAGIQGTLTLNNTPSWSQVNINDGSDNANHLNVLLTATSLTNLAPAVINFQANSLNGLTITVGNGNNTYTVANTAFSGAPGGNPTVLNTGNGADTVLVQGTDATAPLTINTGSGDTVNLTSASNTLDPIGAVTVNDSTGTSVVTVDDSGYGGSDSYFVTSANVTIGRSSSFSLSYSGIGALTLNGGSGSDVYYVDSTSVATTVNGGGGGNIFRISPFTQYLAASILGPSLTLNGGGGDILEFFDANDPNVEGFNFDPVPQSLTLDSTGTDITDFFGMGGGVYAVTNGMSNENDLSGTVIFDPSGGPPGAGGNAPQAARGGPRQVLAELGNQPMIVEAPTKATAGTGDVAGSVPVQAASAALDWADAIDKVFSL
jgi:hypothetical protein